MHPGSKPATFRELPVEMATVADLGAFQAARTVRFLYVAPFHLEVIDG